MPNPHPDERPLIDSLRSLALLVASPRKQLLKSIAKKQRNLISAMKTVGNVPADGAVSQSRLDGQPSSTGHPLAGHTRLDPLSKRELLRLLRMELTYASLTGLKSVDPVNVLKLAKSGLSAAGLERVKQLVCLTTWDGFRQQLIETGLKPLADLSRLKRLWLSGTRLVVTEDVQPQEFAALEDLRLGDMQISDQELSHLAALGDLEVLILNSLDLTDAGLYHLQRMVNLKTLDLSGNPQITDLGIGHLAGLTSLWFLSLDETQVGDDCLRHLQGLKKLKSLYLDQTNVTDRGLESILQLSHLETLSLAGTQITDDGVTVLGRFPNLRRLFLTGTTVTDEGLWHLTRWPELQTLCLDETEITDNGLRCLSAITALQVVSLIGTRTTQVGVEDLKRALPNCEILE